MDPYFVHFTTMARCCLGIHQQHALYLVVFFSLPMPPPPL